MRTEVRGRWVGSAALCALLALTLACKEKAETPTGEPTRPRPRPPGAQQLAAVPDPQVVAINDLAVAVRVNRLDQVFSKVDALVGQVMPGMNSAMVKAQLGGQLGDPALANLDQTRSVMFCVFDPAGAPAPQMAAVIPVTSDEYQARFKGMGLFVYPEQPGAKTLVVAQEEGAMVAARQAFKQLEAMLGGAMTTDLSVYVNVELLLSRHQKQIEDGITQLRQQMAQMHEMVGQPAGTATMLAMEVHGLYSVAKDIKDLDVSVGVSKDGLDLGVVMRGKPGSGLAKMLTGQLPADPALLGYLPGTGALVGIGGGDGKMVAEYLNAKLDDIFTAVPGAETAAINRDALKKLIESSVAMTGAGAFDALSPGSNMLNWATVTEVTDPKAYAGVVRDMAKSMQDSGLPNMYKSMGMDLKLTVQENARQHAGVPIFKVAQEFAAPQLDMIPPPMNLLFKQFTHMEYEVAIVDNYAISALGDQKMDGIIDAIKAKKSGSVALESMNAFPKGGIAYMDVRPGPLANWLISIAQMMMGEMFQAQIPGGDQIIPRLKQLQAKPVMVYMAAAEGKFQGRLVLPVDPIVKVKNIFTSPGMPVAP